MFGRASPTRRRGKADGEKPFWISYADLMTAMMVLFLSAMAVTIAAVGLTASLAAQAGGLAYDKHLEGGMLAWKAAGLPTSRTCTRRTACT